MDNDIDDIIKVLEDRKQLDKELFELKKSAEVQKFEEIKKELKAINDDVLDEKRNVHKNLNSIMANEHFLRQATQRANVSEELRVSSKHHQETIRLFQNMSKLLSEWKGTASNLKTVQELEAKYNKLAEDMRNYNEGVSNDIVKLKNSLMNVKAMSEKVIDLKLVYDAQEAEENEMDQSISDTDMSDSIFE